MEGGGDPPSALTQIRRGERLLDACRQNDFRLVRFMLQSEQVNVNFRNSREGTSALMVAADTNNEYIMKILLEFAPNIDLLNAEKQSASHIAARAGSFNCLHLLVGQGANMMLQDITGKTVLHHAVMSASMDTMLAVLATTAAPALLNVTDTELFTALTYACSMGLNEQVRVLLKKDAKTDIPTKEGAVCLFYAAANRDTLIAQYLLEKNPALAQFTDPVGQTAFHVALAESNIGLADILLQYGADKNALIDTKRGALHWAVIEPDKIDCVKFLINNEVDLDIQDIYGASALHYAVQYENAAAVMELVLAEANAEVRDEERRTTLMWAILHQSSESFRLLLDSLVSLDAVDSNGYTALHYAAHAGVEEYCKSLLDCGAHLDARDRLLQPPLFRAVIGGNATCVPLLISPSNINCQDSNGRTALHWCCVLSQTRCMRLLLHHGADPQIPDHQSVTCLHEAASIGNKQTLLMLLEKRVDINAKDELDASPLHWAARAGSVDCCRILLERGALKNEGQRLQVPGIHVRATPLDLAMTAHADQCVRCLRYYGAITWAEKERNAIKLIQATYKMYLRRRKKILCEKSARVIQRFFRRYVRPWIDKVKTLRAKNQPVNASRVIQKAWRSHHREHASRVRASISEKVHQIYHEAMIETDFTPADPPQLISSEPPQRRKSSVQLESSPSVLLADVLEGPPVLRKNTSNQTLLIAAKGAAQQERLNHTRKPASNTTNKGKQTPKTKMEAGWDATFAASSTLIYRTAEPSPRGVISTRSTNYDVALPGLLNPLVSTRGNGPAPCPPSKGTLKLPRIQNASNNHAASSQSPSSTSKPVTEEEKQMANTVLRLKDLKLQCDLVKRTMEASKEIEQMDHSSESIGSSPEIQAIRKALRMQIKNALNEVSRLRGQPMLLLNSQLNSERSSPLTPSPATEDSPHNDTDEPSDLVQQGVSTVAHN